MNSHILCISISTVRKFRVGHWRLKGRGRGSGAGLSLCFCVFGERIVGVIERTFGSLKPVQVDRR